MCYRAVYRNLTNSNFSVACSLTTTIHIFFRWQPTIFSHTFPPQLFRWRYILNVFPRVKYNYSIHILSTIFRVIYHSRFSVCVFCMQIFRSYCNSIFRVVLAFDFSVGVLVSCIFLPCLRFVPCRASELFPWRVGVNVGVNPFISFSAHASNLQSLIKRFIFPFKGIFSVLPIRTSTMRLSSDTWHLSS